MASRKAAKKKVAMPIRYTALRVDSSLEAAQRTIERMLKLPAGSVKFVYPSGRKARSDSTVGALLKHWDRVVG